MRILICIATMEAGGAERQVTYVAGALVAEGNDVHVCVIRDGPNGDRMRTSGAAIHRLDIYPAGRRFVLPILRLIRRIRPDVVYLWQRPFDVLGAIASAVAGVACVHAERTDPSRIQDGWKVLLRRWLVPRGSGVIANSEAGADYWRRHGVPSARVAVIPNVVPLVELAAVTPSRECAGAALVAGRIDEGKNVLRLVEAAATLTRNGFDVPLCIAGAGPLRDAVERLAQEQGIDSQIRFLGYRADVWELMKGSGVFVSLSRYEGEPNAVLEAAALGCRLILSDIPAHRAIADGTDTWFVSPDSVEDIATALQAALGGLPRERRSTHAGRLDGRSPSEVARAHTAFFERVLERPAAGMRHAALGL